MDLRHSNIKVTQNSTEQCNRYSKLSLKAQMHILKGLKSQNGCEHQRGLVPRCPLARNEEEHKKLLLDFMMRFLLLSEVAVDFGVSGMIMTSVSSSSFFRGVPLVKTCRDTTQFCPAFSHNEHAELSHKFKLATG